MFSFRLKKIVNRPLSLPIILCSPDSIRCSGLNFFAATHLKLLLGGFLMFLICPYPFHQSKCLFYIVLWISPPFRWFCWGWTSYRLWSADYRRGSGHRLEQVRQGLGVGLGHFIFLLYFILLYFAFFIFLSDCLLFIGG